MTPTSDRIRELFPLPFVAVVVLLLVLILLTPNLLSLGRPTAGSLETEAELLVDRAPNQNLTHFYIEGIGTVRYVSITIALAHPPGGPAPSLPEFLFANRTVWNDSIVAEVTTAWDPVAVNVSATYVDTNGAVAFFVGVFEFNITATTISSESYFPAPASASTTSVNALPITFLLDSVPSGSFP